MNKYIYIATIFFILLSSCNKEEKTINTTIKFTHNWNGTPVTSQDFNNFKFTNKNGETISIEKLRYLISNISLKKDKNYTLVDLGENTGLSMYIEDIKDKNLELKFTFGFNDQDNIDGIYTDLNSTSFNVPQMMGGGYHYMQFDGKFKNINNQNENFNYHVIRAVDRTDPDNLILEDTSFEVNLGNISLKNESIIEIKMNIAEWFQNPNTWNLNELNTMLMPNFNAQKLMNANGKTVFSLGEITQ